MAEQQAATVQLTLADGSVRAFPAGVTPRQVAQETGMPVDELVCATWDGELIDLDRPLETDGRLGWVDAASDQGLEVIRHSTAHLMAQAIKRLYPEAQLAIGPPVENGFYYDIDLERRLTPEDLEKLEEEMRRIVAEDLPIRREVVATDEARRLFQELGESYKLEILAEIDDPTVSLYRQGEFVDLCRGPHVVSTGRLGAFKLLNVAGAYWRGDAQNKQLQRLYGTAFPTQEGAGGVPAASGRGGAPGPPPAGAGAGALQPNGGGARLPLLPPQGDGDPQRAGGPLAAGAHPAGVPGDPHPHPLEPGALAPLGPLGPLPGEHVLHPDR